VPRRADTAQAEEKGETAKGASMILDRVTLTGADDSVDPEDLVALAGDYSFVEWGILFSASRQGTPRYPSAQWITELWEASHAGLRLSAHLCGKWVRELILDGNFSWRQDVGQAFDMFERIQLNFHAHHLPANEKFLDVVRKYHDLKQFIFQMDGVNDQLWKSVKEGSGQVVPLFDRSGGAGVLPENWPRAYTDVYCGYAGGLGPVNLLEELSKIENMAGQERIWIDAETRVRSNEDKLFDLEKVREFLEISKDFVEASKP
jgi:hypothetical protein